jgi:mannosyl-3-phosphoglycerate phosphatase
MKKIIFTDLDGTLLHPETYSYREAQPALDLIRKEKIPLVFCSSKTRAEIELYRERLDNFAPFITENGGGIFVPVGYFPFLREKSQGNMIITALGKPYELIRKEFTELRRILATPVKGFGDMTVEQISRITGLPPAESVLARSRDYSEPFLFENGDHQEFLKAVMERGLQWTRGRLYCLMGNHDKGRAIEYLKKWYETLHGKIVTIALGDALNDQPLLERADFPVLVQKNDGTYDPDVRISKMIKAPGIGPIGWNRAIISLLNE